MRPVPDDRLPASNPCVAALRFLGACAALLALGACAARAPVGTDFPRPLVDPLPLRMGVEFPETLKSYEHVESIPGDREWIVTLGPANTAMFARVFEAMFEETVILGAAADPAEADADAGAKPGGGEDAVEDAGEPAPEPAAGGQGGGTAEAAAPPLDAILIPSIESYEFANPLEAEDEYTTVWITYRMRLTTPDGRVIAEWPVRAYGRSRYGFLGAKESLVDATHMAMRDAGAYITLYFAEEPRVREWLRESGKLATPEAP